MQYLYTYMFYYDDDDDMGNPIEFDWQSDYFNQFRWLEGSHAPPFEMGNQSSPTSMRNVFLPMLQASMGVNMLREPNIGLNIHENKLYMYFISLEQDKMFLYVDFKDESHESIMKKAAEKHEFIQVYKPQKIVFTMEIKDLYDIDKTVKLFMHMFGVDNTRGGSYTSIILDEHVVDLIEKEKEVTQVEHYAKA